MPFETFVHARTLTLALPLPLPPPKKKKKKKKKRFLSNKESSSIERATHTSPHSSPNFFLIWFFCQLDSVLVIVLIFDKESIHFLGGGGGCGGGGVTIKCTNV